MSNSITTASNPRVGEDVGRELERLSAKATPGPWRHIVGDDYYIESDSYPPKATHNPVVVDSGWWLAVGNRPDDFGEANSQFIVALVNAFRSGKLVASTGSGKEETKGEPSGTGYSSETTPSGRGPAGEYPSRVDRIWDDETRNVLEVEADQKIEATARTLPFEINKHFWTIKAHVTGIFDHSEDPHVRDDAVAIKSSLADLADALALGTEARSAETFGLGPKDDGPADLSATPDLLSHLRAENANLRDRVREAEEAAAEVAAWKRVAVIAAIPLEAMRMGGSYRTLAPSTQTCVDEAVVTIRMAVAGHSLPPDGDLDAGLAPARAALSPEPGGWRS